jgi:alpha-tubulin suppressor-like RCC1 family protein
MQHASTVLLLAGAALLSTACTTILGDDFAIAGSGGQTGQGGDTGGTGGACTPNTTSCADDATLRTCDDTGQPHDTACPQDTPACVSGACVPCQNGASGCQGKDRVQCVAGSWQVQESCPVGCEGATCLQVVDLGAGIAHTCAVLSNGTVRCWGYNQLELLYLDGLDDPPPADSYVTTPTPVPDMQNALRVQGGDASSCVLTSAAEVACWGWNGIGQLGTGTYANETSPSVVALSSNVVDFAVGVGHTCAALDTGPVACWGLNEQGQIGNGSSGSNQMVPTPFELNLGVPAANVTAGSDHTCARTTGEEVGCWGGNNSGQLGDGTTTASTTPVGSLGEGVKQIGAGAWHTCAVLFQQLVCFGSNNSGQIGSGSAGGNALSPTAPTGLGMVKQIGAGGMHTCAIDPNDLLWCWGRNDEGQIGNGDSGAGVDQLQPIQVNIGTVRDVAAGHLHTCALTTDDVVYCWGLNNRGQLGTGDTTSQATPTPVVW